MDWETEGGIMDKELAGKIDTFLVETLCPLPDEDRVFFCADRKMRYLDEWYKFYVDAK